MKIQPNASDGQPPALRFDPTKPARDAIKKQQPLPPPAEAAEPPADPDATAAKVKEARDEFRTKRQGRIANARRHYTANHAAELAAEHATEVAKARAEHAAKLAPRQEALEAKRATHKGPDSIDISSHSRELLDEALQRTDEPDSQRADRVRELRERYLAGKLNTDELISRSADKLLGGQ